jgi:purine-binding chemotaxis protein CheW
MMSNKNQQIKSDEVAEQMVDQRAGKYLTFQLGNEEYGVEILKVREIIGLMNVTRIPQTPHYIRGVINLRGKVIPVMELRSKFGMELADDTDQTCIVVVEVKDESSRVLTGLVVDAVSEVLDIKNKQIDDAPEFGAGANTDYIMGIGKINDAVKLLLDIDKIVNVGEVSKWSSNAGDENVPDRKTEEKVAK